MPKIIKDGRIYAASPGSLADLGDITITTPTTGEALIWDQSTHKWINGTVSTVGTLNDLTDVTINTPLNRQELVYNDSLEVFQNKTTRVELTTAQYNQLVEDDHVLPNVDYYLTDAPSMTGTAKELSYDGSTDSVYDKIEGLTDNDISHYTGTPTPNSTAEAINGKADKSGMFKIQSFSQTYSVGADSSTNFDNSFITVPTGYTIAGVVGYTTNQDAVVAVSVRPAENSVWAFQLRKVYGSAVSGMTFTVTVLFVKTELVS